jgi:hypothetical protein
MTALAARKGFTILEEDDLSYDARSGLYSFSSRSSLDVSRRWGSTLVYFDGDSGAEGVHGYPPARQRRHHSQLAGEPAHGSNRRPALQAVHHAAGAGGGIAQRDWCGHLVEETTGPAKRPGKAGASGHRGRH